MNLVIIFTRYSKNLYYCSRSRADNDITYSVTLHFKCNSIVGLVRGPQHFSFRAEFSLLGKLLIILGLKQLEKINPLQYNS
jgi:hypothetical protein